MKRRLPCSYPEGDKQEVSARPRSQLFGGREAGAQLTGHLCDAVTRVLCHSSKDSFSCFPFPSAFT